MVDQEEQRHRQMSLIPYTHGEVVLRRGQSVVLYDPESRQLSVRDAVEAADCPYCGRPMRDDFPLDGDIPEEDGPKTPSAAKHLRHEKPLMDPNYFELLAASQHPSPAGSAGPATPTRLVAPAAIRSGRSREVSGVQEPPTGAEFVASEPRPTSGKGISSKAFSPGYFKQFFREIRELGRGGNGVVLLVEHLIDDVSLGLFACKRIPVGNDHSWLEKVLVEVTLLKNISHPNLIRYHFVWLEDSQPTKFGPSVPCLWILQAFCNGGDLHAYVIGPHQTAAENKERLKERLRSRSKSEMEPLQDLHGPSKLTFEEIFSFFRDITSGLHCLHSQNYIHRDLKPSNCLIVKEGGKTRILISDFGEVQTAGAKRGSTGATGTISYCAPEVLQCNEKGIYGEFTTKSDIFSLGMIVYFMCFGRLPYSNAGSITEEDEDLDELRAEITKWPGFDDEIRSRPDLPERLYRYLKRLLSVDPNERPSTEEILVSIKAGAGLAESTIPEDASSPRVVALDQSDWQHQNQPKHQRPSFPRSKSRRDGTSNSRVPSPRRRRPSSQSYIDEPRAGPPVATSDASIVVRPRKLDISPPVSPPLAAPSPRLMLPPPEPRGVLAHGHRVLSHELTISIIQIALFVAKVLSMSFLCQPYAVSGFSQVLMLLLAILDFGGLPWTNRRSLLLFGLHFAYVTTLYRKGGLCARQSVDWG